MTLDLDELLAHAEDVREYPPFGVIFSEGSPGDYLYVLLEGEVSVSIRGTDIWTLKPGEVFGEMALIDRQPRSATAMAATTVRVIRIDELGFLKLVKEAPRFSLHVMRVMAKRLRALDDTLA